VEKIAVKKKKEIFFSLKIILIYEVVEIVTGFNMKIT